mmetsp:Transcript_175226/g.556557  ORF Transcript_175226/g.556557 Transcript_175226/m.556557 type:complete len:205 (-) Transcript_175226:676-1290(-)
MLLPPDLLAIHHEGPRQDVFEPLQVAFSFADSSSGGPTEENLLLLPGALARVTALWQDTGADWEVSHDTLQHALVTVASADSRHSGERRRLGFQGVGRRSHVGDYDGARLSGIAPRLRSAVPLLRGRVGYVAQGWRRCQREKWQRQNCARGSGGPRGRRSLTLGSNGRWRLLRGCLRADLAARPWFDAILVRTDAAVPGSGHEV